MPPESPHADAPPDSSARELQRLERLANTLDAAFPLPATRWRVGIDALIGLIPGVGDAAGGRVSFYLIGRAWRLGLPRATRLRMLGNVALELIIGPIPLLGDLFDAWFKANRRNMALLREALQDQHAPGVIPPTGRD